MALRKKADLGFTLLLTLRHQGKDSSPWPLTAGFVRNIDTKLAKEPVYQVINQHLDTSQIMPPLTSSSGCNSYMTQKISELEGRTSVLYQFKEEEWIINSLVTVTSPGELDSTIPWVEGAAAAPGADQWSKAPVGSTPKDKFGGKPSHCPHPPQAQKLTNALSILDERDSHPLPCSLILSSPERRVSAPQPLETAKQVISSAGHRSQTSSLLTNRQYSVHPLPWNQL